jgi:hypothetical protein
LGQCNEEVLNWFSEFFEAYTKANKLNYKEVLAKFFATPELVG